MTKTLAVPFSCDSSGFDVVTTKQVKHQHNNSASLSLFTHTKSSCRPLRARARRSRACDAKFLVALSRPENQRRIKYNPYPYPSVPIEHIKFSSPIEHIKFSSTWTDGNQLFLRGAGCMESHVLRNQKSQSIVFASTH